ncbi:hypothetical protein CALCODRAFT_146654 [Calocera cornea HHB12733]|uniref:Wax synthase domain-containing protein n=1 Tax=Calocera cornea HHB12733 TaxID=1353952 RepID=A0A165CR98_9BASI|nr:hypothetical protein CALCODRAFT_146654 [Calocera cornea HHB12733]
MLLKLVFNLLFAFGLFIDSIRMRLSLVAALAAIAGYDIICSPSPNRLTAMYDAHTFMNGLLLASDLLILHNPKTDVWHRQAGHIQQQPLDWKKILLALELTVNSRGIGWNFDVRGSKSSRLTSTESRAQFIVRQVARGTAAWLLIDLTRTIFRYRNTCHIQGSLFQDGPTWQAVYVLAGWTNIAGSMVVPHAVIAAITVGVGLYRPEDWPKMFDIAEGYTVRRFWG